MKLAIAGTGGGHPRRRLLVMAALLVLSLGLGAGLALQAIQTSLRYRQTAERALRDYASFAAFILASHTYRELGGAVVEKFSAWPMTPRHGPAAGTACAGGNTFFERPPGAALHFSGAVLASATAAFLVDTLRNAMPLLEETGWRFRFIRSTHGGPDGFFIASYQATPGKYGLRGFSACLGGADSPFRRVMLAEPTLPPSVTGGRVADSLFAVTVTDSAGPPLFISPRSYTSPYSGTARLGSEFADVAVHLVLRADLAGQLVIGGIPSSPTPLAAGLLGLSTLLVVTALFQLRREYELITIRSDFVANVSHELRTPLSQILIFTELLKLGRLRSEAERSRSLEIIDQETRRLIRLVENVLQFSRSDGSRTARPKDPLPLERAVRETLDAFRPLATARDATLHAEIALDAFVLADPSALRQILLNLLDNAVKYGPKGQTVRVEARTSAGRARISVQDQGPGIPLEHRERVWQGYYRLQREEGSAVAGSGIGLAVVRSLASEMGGTAWVEDGETGGARFVVELASASGIDS